MQPLIPVARACWSHLRPGRLLFLYMFLAEELNAYCNEYKQTASSTPNLLITNNLYYLYFFLCHLTAKIASSVIIPWTHPSEPPSVLLRSLRLDPQRNPETSFTTTEDTPTNQMNSINFFIPSMAVPSSARRSFRPRQLTLMTQHSTTHSPKNYTATCSGLNLTCPICYPRMPKPCLMS